MQIGVSEYALSSPDVRFTHLISTLKTFRCQGIVFADLAYCVIKC
jgi:hypothetical protein